MDNIDLVITNNKEIVVGDGKDEFIIEAEELIEGLENIGDYEGIKEVEKDLELLDK